ncbi:hypothetical protein MASR2M17_18440 [Aminivibrio sp.]
MNMLILFIQLQKEHGADKWRHAVIDPGQSEGNLSLHQSHLSCGGHVEYEFILAVHADKAGVLLGNKA